MQIDDRLRHGNFGRILKKVTFERPLLCRAICRPLKLYREIQTVPQRIIGSFRHKKGA